MENRSSKAVADFFTTMLEEGQDATPLPVLEELDNRPLERLLAKVTPVLPDVEPEPEAVEPLLSYDTQTDTDVSLELQAQPEDTNPLRDELDEPFAVLYFSVADVMFAVPLIKLKAIYRLGQPTKLFGKPDWFSGIQIERDEKIAIVDTGRYLMPEKFNSDLEQSTNYQYIIVLGDKNWGLKCDSLVDSENLSHDDIKWRVKTNTSPWLAGTVKQRMCGLLAVDALIELFEQNSTV